MQRALLTMCGRGKELLALFGDAVGVEGDHLIVEVEPARAAAATTSERSGRASGRSFTSNIRTVE